MHHDRATRSGDDRRPRRLTAGKLAATGRLAVVVRSGSITRTESSRSRKQIERADARSHDGGVASIEGDDVARAEPNGGGEVGE